jgi:HEAT repeat protein
MSIRDLRTCCGGIRKNSHVSRSTPTCYCRIRKNSDLLPRLAEFLRIQLLLYLCLSTIGCVDSTGKLVAQLGSSDLAVRRAAAAALDDQPSTDERAIAGLIKSLGDSDADVRYRAASALGKLGAAAKSAQPALRSALQDTEQAVRIRAAFSLARIDPQDRSFVPVLTAAMRNGDGRTLLEIGNLGAAAAWATPTLAGLLSHESPKVRILAANDLGRIGPAAASAKPALEAAARDSNAAVQHAAQNALLLIEPKSTSPAK